jgi:drug/metabolite transporter (DMT)-like permease
VRTWLTLAVVLVYLASLARTLQRIRLARQTGATHSYGHPMLDNVLLLLAALFLAAVLVGASYLEKGYLHGTGAHLAFYLIAFSIGGVLTWFCTFLLRRAGKHK